MKSFAEIYEFSLGVEGNGTHDHTFCTATAAELKIFVSSVMSLPSHARVLEIGTYTGRSSSVYFQLQKDLSLDIHLVDLWAWNEPYGINSFSSMVLKNFNDVPFTLHKMPSQVLGATWRDLIDFLYIDGDHTIPGLEFDCQLFLPRVTNGGLAVFHDCHMPDVEYCLKKYVSNEAWELHSEAERMTIWRKS